MTAGNHHGGTEGTEMKKGDFEWLQLRVARVKIQTAIDALCHCQDVLPNYFPVEQRPKLLEIAADLVDLSIEMDAQLNDP